jgi:hypothetical protein
MATNADHHLFGHQPADRRLADMIVPNIAMAIALECYIACGLLAGAVKGKR